MRPRGTEALLACQVLHVPRVGLLGPGEGVWAQVSDTWICIMSTQLRPPCVFVLKNKLLSDTCQSKSDSVEGGNGCRRRGHPRGGTLQRELGLWLEQKQEGAEAVKVLRGTLGVPIPAKLP